MEINNLNKTKFIQIKHKLISNIQKLKKNNDILNMRNSKSLIHIRNSNKNKSKKYITKSNFLYFHFINILLIINLLLFFPKKVISGNCEIELGLNEAGEQQIFSDEFNISESYPISIRVNNQEKALNNKKIELESSNNIIRINWNQTNYDLSYIFSNLTNIISVTINYCVSENAINISYMFYGCDNLQSFSLINEISVNDLRGIFYDCNKLISLDLNKIIIANLTNMSYTFYNCHNLESINWNNKLSQPSDMRSMLYNCISINSLNLPFKQTDLNINMSRMFYNCFNIETIIFSTNSEFYPNDISEMFYNCNSLQSLNLKNIIYTDYTINISYLFYNCTNLSNLRLNFSNILTKDMTGAYQNCKSMKFLTFQNFNTSSAENMSKMFSGCSNLESIDLTNLNTSQVVNMESMFEGCSSLIYLSLDNFETPKVEKFNNMFADCTSLKSLNFKNININRVITMNKMFYNCKSLQYFNLYSLHEYGELSIDDMFTGVSDNFSFCIGVMEYIPKIFGVLLNMNNADRNCSMDCFNQIRYKIPETKLCCSKLRYNGKCYTECPKKTHVSTEVEATCEFFDCPNPDQYYNYQQNNCTYNISGYYVNDAEAKTIDKCHEDCIECKGKSSDQTTNCITCKSTKPYIYLGNCYETCIPGFYDPPNNTICKCFEPKCKLCSEESLEKNLCIECNDGYYPIENDISNIDGWMDCYKDPENYYLEDNIYKSCYPSCKHCRQKGNINKHLCLSCNNENTFSIKTDDTTYNCYPNCSYYYYFDENNTYYCTNGPLCPIVYNKLIDGERKCIKSCTETENKRFEFRGVCYENCPFPSFNLSENDYFCRINCAFEEPFELIQEQICVSKCTIMERYNKLCITNYNGNMNNVVQDKILENIKEDITDTFDYNYINQNNNKIIIEERDYSYEITDTSNFNLGECEHILKSYYNIDNNANLYTLKIDNKKNGILQFMIYYPLNGIKLVELNLSLCEGREGDGINNLMLSAYSEEENKIFSQESGNEIFQITNSKKELELLKNKSNNIYNISIIDLGECETILKTKYNISENDSLIFIKNEIKSNKVSEKNIKFDVYNPYNKQKLNLSLCDETPINIYFPMVLSEETKQIYEQMKNSGYDMFNINDPFYQDICTPFDSPDGTDILLSDRIDYIYNNDDTQCQSNCQFSEYSIESQYLSCSCSIQEDENNQNEKKDKFNAKKIYESFYEVLKYSNYDILKCYKIILDINVIKINLGSIIVLIYFFCYLICLFYHMCKGIASLKNKLIKELQEQKNIYLNFKFDIQKLLYPPIKKKTKNKIILRKNKTNIYSKSNSKYNVLDKTPINFHNIKNEELKKNNKKRTERAPKRVYSDYELNELEYEKAVKLDRRSLCKIYWATLQREHLIIFTFFNCNDYNLLAVKISRFVFLIVGDMASNVFFFSDDSMHKLFLNYGKYDFIQQIPQITYSTIISQIIEVFLCFLSLTDKYIYQIKADLINGNIRNIKNIIKCIRIKLIIYFIFIFLFFCIYWYIISVFCGVYRNTQIAFIKDSIISFSICLAYPLILYFLSACLRICSLRDSRKRFKCVYKLSYIIPFF